MKERNVMLISCPRKLCNRNNIFWDSSIRRWYGVLVKVSADRGGELRSPGLSFLQMGVFEDSGGRHTAYGMHWVRIFAKCKKYFKIELVACGNYRYPKQTWATYEIVIINNMKISNSTPILWYVDLFFILHILNYLAKDENILEV